MPSLGGLLRCHHMHSRDLTQEFCPEPFLSLLPFACTLGHFVFFHVFLNYYLCIFCDF